MILSIYIQMYVFISLKKNKTFFNIQEYLVYHRVHQNSNFNAKKLSYSVIDILIKNKIYAY
jgi:hypothetical protein